MGLDFRYIDGQTPLDEDEKLGLKIKSISIRAELDEWEQLNIESAIQWSMGLNISLEKLICEEFVQALHRRMYGQVWQWAGRFRDSNKNIGVDKYQIGMELKKLCDDFIYWHQQEIFSSGERIIRFKHRLVSIHCFANGNGRHSRLMADIIAQKLYNMNVFNWGNSAHLNHNSDLRKLYIAALRMADQGDYTALMDFVTSQSDTI